ncbi:glycogen synthase [Flavobacterium sp. UMI-01]|uniref:glycogen synthase n=1 Tax=Flavobacterium sp. UMI-01 TaxID=1441053 RepID=UPI001C7D2D45|nr:glycogen/starch synthase [Flavobacterium sp. UMI-01]GIZ08653.1 glycogen synthase [Flavobacterium sp. UMI-01]
MELFHISAESYPAAKVGGLADVVGALAKYQQEQKHTVNVVIPCYETNFIKENEFETVFWSHVALGQFNFPFSVLKGINNDLGYQLYLIAIPELFDRAEIYGYKDDIERFVSFQKAFLDWLLTVDTKPTVINCHDHHTALIPFLLNYGKKYVALKDIPTLLTVHNALYQGQFGFDKLHYFPEYDLSKTDILQWNGCINSMAAGLRCARAITTVSPNYLNEICYSGNGLEMLFNQVKYKSRGILNGIDTVVWNPETDSKIEFNYSVATCEMGKQKNKEKLCKMFDLDVHKPLISYIGRLYDEKGADLLYEFVKKSLSEKEREINILILGSGNVGIEKQLQELVADYSGHYNVYIGFNEDMAHLMYAGTDFLLMPSRVESCGLNQMYAYRYGAIPVVRNTGGLKDTVIDIDEKGFGIGFNQASVEDMLLAKDRAVELFHKKNERIAIIESGMMLNHSWEKAYKEYLEMYNLIIK